MLIIDWVALGIVAVMALLGLLLGFGKGLKFFTSGIFGVIISIVVCWLFGEMFRSLPFVQSLLAKIASLWAEQEGFFFDLLRRISAETVIYYIVLFFIIQILRIVIVLLIKKIAESEVTVIKVLNKIFGLVMFVAIGIFFLSFGIYVVAWVGGSTYEEVLGQFNGSVFGFDYLLQNFKNSFETVEETVVSLFYAV